MIADLSGLETSGLRLLPTRVDGRSNLEPEADVLNNIVMLYIRIRRRTDMFHLRALSSNMSCQLSIPLSSIVMHHQDAPAR